MVGTLVALLLALPGDEGLLRAGKDIPGPRRTHHVEPGYPEMARLVFPPLMGVVVLDVSVNEEGTPVDVKVVRSIPWVEVAAREAALKWRYEPTVVDGRPRPVIVRELVDMFPDLSTRARFWSDRVKNPGLDEPLRIEAAERLVVAGVKKKFVLEALGKAVRDPDPDISAAAASALRSLSTP